MSFRRCPWCGQGFFREDRYLSHFTAEAIDRNHDYVAARKAHREVVGIPPAAGRGRHG
jgi:hypothetical protein